MLGGFSELTCDRYPHTASGSRTARTGDHELERVCDLRFCVVLGASAVKVPQLWKLVDNSPAYLVVLDLQRVSGRRGHEPGTSVGSHLTTGESASVPCFLSLRTDPTIKEVNMTPDELQKVVAAWRSLPEDEQVARLRRCVVDEVVGNMRVEGQPVSAEWEAAAREAVT